MSAGMLLINSSLVVMSGEESELSLLPASSSLDEFINTFTKSAIGQRDARAYETPGQKLGFLSQMITYDLKPEFVDQQNEILANLTKDEVDSLAKKHLNIEEMIMVVVGDKDDLIGKLETLGLPIEEIDADGKPVK